MRPFDSCKQARTDLFVLPVKIDELGKNLNKKRIM